MPSLLEKIVEQRVGQSPVGTASVAVEKIAEEIAREALADLTFRRLLRETVQARSQQILDGLLKQNGARSRAGRKRSRKTSG